MTTNGDRALLLALPLPLAEAWRRTLCAEAPLEGHERALLTLESVLEYLAAIAAATWVARGAEGDAPRKACEALVRPSLGQWAGILRACAPALPEGDPIRGWLDRVRAEAVAGEVEGLPGRTVDPVLQAVPAYRNTIAHGAGLTPERAAEVQPAMLALTRTVLTSLVGEDAPILTGIAGVRRVRLMGGVTLEPGAPDQVSGTVAIRLVDRSIVLSPLWILDAAEDDILVLNKGAGLKKVEYLSYGRSRGATGLSVRKGDAAERAGRLLESATGCTSLDAAELADDLERYLGGRPVLARPVGPVIRALKWSRRNPGRAGAMAGAVLVVLVAVGLLLWQRIDRERRARTGAEQARMEAGSHVSDYDSDYETVQEEIAGLKEVIAGEREACMNAYAPTARRAAFACMELELTQKQIEAEGLLQSARASLERAARLEAPWGGPSPETQDAFASFYLGRWREAVENEDAVREKVCRNAVEAHDRDGRYAGELLSRGTLTVTVQPPDAEVYLFRYVSYETVRKEPPVVPRLVPVPTTGIGRCRPGPWLEEQDFYPGDLCLEVTGVEEGSIAAKAGLKPGDLIVSLNGQPCGDGLFVAELPPRGPAVAAGVKHLDRIESLWGKAVEGMFEWEHPPRSGKKETPYTVSYTLVVARGNTVAAKTMDDLVNTFGLRPGTPVDLVSGEAPDTMELLTLRAGETVPLIVPRGKRSGLSVEVTAYPLILSAENRVASDKKLTCDPGSYLLLFRREGFEDQRFPVVVPREGNATTHVEMLEAGTTPPGFVYVPPGPFGYGGDPEAYHAGPWERIDLDGFFIARKEVTNREYFEFLNDPRVRKLIDLEKGASARFVPRPSDTVMVRKDGDRLVPGYGTPETPVLGINLYDIQAYLRWRIQREQVVGGGWLFALPDEYQWEKAARGVDGRCFPWGNRFDPSLTVGAYRKTDSLLSVAGGFELRDESPYGLWDMGGSRVEWCSNECAPGSGTFPLRGGAWVDYIVPEGLFRIARRGGDPNDWCLSHAPRGFRVVIRKVP